MADALIDAAQRDAGGAVNGKRWRGVRSV